MGNKLKTFFDSKTTWLTIGTVAGSLFGTDIANTVNALGVLVMAVL